MAMAWIVRIRNQSNGSVVVRQSDPSWHPVIENSQGVLIIEHNIANPNGGVQVQSGEGIQIAPGGMLIANSFVVPWQGYGTLLVQQSNRMDNAVVGPQGGKDYIIINNRVDPSLCVGRQNWLENTEYEMRISPHGALQFVPPGSPEETVPIQTGMVFAVDSVSIQPVSSVQWKITALGKASSAGWTSPRLQKRPGTSTGDGILDLDFVAVKPTETVIQALQPISAGLIWDNPPQFAKGVYVYASSNMAKKLIR